MQNSSVTPMFVGSPSPLAPDAGRVILTSLFSAALEAVDPLLLVPQFLPPRPRGRVVVVGAGKAAARMALALERHWDAPLTGLVITRYGHGEPCQRIEVVEAGHPTPDEAGAQATQRICSMVKGLGRDDLVIALISGGGSSLLSAPAPGLSLGDKREVTRALLHCGATIFEINCVRKHLSSVKGGQLAQACGAAALMTLVISDVPGDDPSTVASGPTFPDASLPSDALAILQRYGITPSKPVLQVLQAAPKEQPPASMGERHHAVIACAQAALDSAAAKARSLGLRPIILSNSIEGEARHIGTMHAAMARQISDFGQPESSPSVLLSGGETTVTVAGTGRGGRNAEFLLAELINLRGASGIWGLAADTDGIDGSEPNAGAVFGPDNWLRGQQLGLSAQNLLADNNAFSYFEVLGDLVITGPTRTNVNDFRATLIL